MLRLASEGYDDKPLLDLSKSFNMHAAQLFNLGGFDYVDYERTVKLPTLRDVILV